MKDLNIRVLEKGRLFLNLIISYEVLEFLPTHNKLYMLLKCMII